MPGKALYTHLYDYIDPPLTVTVLRPDVKEFAQSQPQIL